MKNIGMNADGELVCPSCGSKNLSNRRTRGAKLVGAVSVGVGVLAVPKRLQCLACREYFKSPAVPLGSPTVSPGTTPSVRAAARPAVITPELVGAQVTMRVQAPAGRLGSFTFVLGALRSAQVEVNDDWKAHIKGALKAGDWATLPPVPVEQAPTVHAKLDQAHLAVQFDEASLAHVEPAQPAPEVASPARSAGSSLADELSKLAALREQGILTEDEFAAQKARLLA